MNLESHLHLHPRDEDHDAAARSLLFAHVVGLVFSFFTTILVVRILSLEEYATLVLVMAVMYVTTLTSQWGYTTVIARHTPAVPHLARLICRNSLGLQIPLGFVLILLGLVIWQMFGIRPVNHLTVALLGCSFAFVGLRRSIDVSLRSIGYARIESFLILLERCGTFVGLLSLYLMTSLSGVDLIAYGMVIGPSISLLFGFLFYFGLPMDSEAPSLETRPFALFKQGFPYVIVVALAPLIGDMDKFVLTWVGSLSELPMYDVAWRLQMAGAALVIAVHSSLLTSIRKYRDDSSVLHSVRLRSSQMNARLVLLGISVGPLAAVLLVPLVFGEAYTGAVEVVILLIGAWSVSLLTSSMLVGVRAGCRGRDLQFALLCGILIDAILTVVLAGQFGASAAGFGTIALFWTTSLLCIRPLKSHGLGVLILQKEWIWAILSTLFMIGMWYILRYDLSPLGNYVTVSFLSLMFALIIGLTMKHVFMNASGLLYSDE